MSSNPPSAARAAAETYFACWRAHDFDTLRTVLDPDVEFAGPMGTAFGIDACVAGLKGMAEAIMTDLIVRARVTEGADVITWYDLVTPDGRSIPTANWSHLENGLITQIRAVFDPRPLVSATEHAPQ